MTTTRNRGRDSHLEAPRYEVNSASNDRLFFYDDELTEAKKTADHLATKTGAATVIDWGVNPPVEIYQAENYNA